ncbi:hypothetical protein GRF59_22090 [Paenibacillus sp. HJL G12]|uniref:Uncharacterized protein n=1 Tax=Paenibacillus dendrobii TaxID=2691084 RepID=A0A7X3ILU0_9BACL|nr:hypothetical protein [Paenibacillus dendrobii]MWV46299.1 hypothetical protein [Paenibacillus dendrobii]
MTHKKWTLLTLLFTALVLLAIVTVNYVVDPYGIYHFSGRNYNVQKSKNSDPYLFKTFQSRKYQPQALVLGTSRAMRLNPPLIKSLTGDNTYNLGLSAATPYIDLNYLQYVIKVDQNLKTVFLGLDFEVFDNNYPNHVSFNEKRLNSSFYTQDLFTTLLSETALKESRKVVMDNLNKTTDFTETRYLGDGSFDENLVYPPYTNQNTLQTLPTSFQLSASSMLYVKKMKELCEQNGLKLYIYISPVHAIILETYWQNNLWGKFEDWKRELVDIAPVWDFSGYHEISMSSLRNEKNYNDLSHFSKKVGNLILYRMLNKEMKQVPSYFGVYMTPDNIEKHLTDLRLSRENWPERDKNMSEILDNY